MAALAAPWPWPCRWRWVKSRSQSFGTCRACACRWWCSWPCATAAQPWPSRAWWPSWAQWRYTWCARCVMVSHAVLLALTALAGGMLLHAGWALLPPVVVSGGDHASLPPGDDLHAEIHQALDVDIDVGHRAHTYAALVAQRRAQHARGTSWHRPAMLTGRPATLAQPMSEFRHRCAGHGRVGYRCPPAAARTRWWPIDSWCREVGAHRAAARGRPLPRAGAGQAHQRGRDALRIGRAGCLGVRKFSDTRVGQDLRQADHLARAPGFCAAHLQCAALPGRQRACAPGPHTPRSATAPAWSDVGPPAPPGTASGPRCFRVG